MDKTSDKFWEYSFEQMADFDMPATIDLVLEKTSLKKVSFIGHQLGSTIMLAAMS